MEHYINKDALVAEIKRYKHKADERLKIKGRTLAEDCKDSALQNLCGNLLHFLDTLEVKEVENVPNIRFPHYKSIVEKVFGAGNLESFEYKEAEQLVSLAKEELLKDLEVKEVDLEKEYDNEFFKDPVFGKLVNRNAGISIAKHFFELGLKAQKGEEV